MHYQDLAALFASLEETPRRLKKTFLVAGFLKTVSSKDLDAVILLLQGRVFPQWDKRTLGLSEKLVIKAIATASGASEERIMDEWRKVGDIGKVAEKLMGKKSQAALFSEDLTVAKVFGTLQKIAAAEGTGSTDLKVKLTAQLLTSATPVEARYVVRAVIGDLRVGVAEGTLRDAIAGAYLFPGYAYDEEENAMTWDVPAGTSQSVVMHSLQSALDRSNDFATVARLAKEKGLVGLDEVPLIVGSPLKAMLAQKVQTLQEAFDTLGVPCAAEYKYDGFRLQIHKEKESVTLFTRRLEEVTAQFPDVVAVVREHVKVSSCILDSEAVGYDPATGKYRAFQAISQRIRRKYDIEKLSQELPVEVVLFDVLSLEGETTLSLPYETRRALVKSILAHPKKQTVVLATQELISTQKEGETFYKASLAAGNEGIMLKKLDGVYQPGSRVGTMIKLKPTMETFDLVIVGAEWGTGKRSGWLTSFTVACWDEETQEFVTLGRFGTGLKEKEEAKGEDGEGATFEELTLLLKPVVLRTVGRDVTLKPEVVVELAFEEIQASPTYTSGFALRFPRFVRLRDDRGKGDITTLSLVRKTYQKQRGRS
jgi:DNA ligase-1